MAEAQRFSHIKVSDADDDIVIQAGAVSAAASEEAPAPARPQPAQADEAPAAPPAPAREGAYRETTLEDLESSTMGTAQKAVIALAVLGVIAFAVWYCLLR